MFGQNEIVGQNYFNQDGLLVTSIFKTLQGEGPFSGRSAIFIRLAKCNLNCSFCDTYFDSGDWLSFEEIFYRLSNMIENDTKIGIVITGGEPLLQKKLEDFLIKLVEKSYVKFIQIESNGLIYRNLPDKVTLVISPKISEKTKRYLNIHKDNLIRADCLKFVVSHNNEYSHIPNWAFEWRNTYKKDIYISPMNIYNKEPEQTKIVKMFDKNNTLENRSKYNEVVSFWEDGLLNYKENQLNHEYAAKYCIDNDFILSLQNHLYASIA